MAGVNIFEQYGIKEVANVYFEALENDEKAGVYAGDIVLFLDSLKVSTIETTAENVAAQGGWGNPRLVSWDYGKEITITLEDALISIESLRFMLGGAIKRPSSSESVWVRHTAEVTCVAGGLLKQPKDHLTDYYMELPTPSAAHPIRLINLSTGIRTQLVNAADAIDFDEDHISEKAISFKNTAAGQATGVPTKEGDRIRIFWETEVKGGVGETETAVEVTISPSTFPGSYKVVGDTFMRNAKTSKDEPFQFIIAKAKVQSNVTITLEAEGDPSTFEMSLVAERATNEDGEQEMMKLIRYNLLGGTSGTGNGNDEGSLVNG